MQWTLLIPNIYAGSGLTQRYLVLLMRVYKVRLAIFDTRRDDQVEMLSSGA